MRWIRVRLNLVLFCVSCKGVRRRSIVWEEPFRLGGLWIVGMIEWRRFLRGIFQWIGQMMMRLECRGMVGRRGPRVILVETRSWLWNAAYQPPYLCFVCLLRRSLFELYGSEVVWFASFASLCNFWEEAIWNVTEKWHRLVRWCYANDNVLAQHVLYVQCVNNDSNEQVL